MKIIEKNITEPEKYQLILEFKANNPGINMDIPIFAHLTKNFGLWNEPITVKMTRKYLGYGVDHIILEKEE